MPSVYLGTVLQDDGDDRVLHHLSELDVAQGLETRTTHLQDKVLYQPNILVGADLICRVGLSILSRRFVLRKSDRH